MGKYFFIAEQEDGLNWCVKICKDYGERTISGKLFTHILQKSAEVIAGQLQLAYELGHEVGKGEPFVEGRLQK